jgi:hypothetical protein
MVGKFEGDTIIVMDVVPLPVEGSETRVNAADTQECQNYMIEWLVDPHARLIASAFPL